MRLKIFYIDRFIEHSVDTYNALHELISQNNEYEIFFIGSDDNKPNIFSNQNIKNSKKVWSKGDFLKKIFMHVYINKPDLVHFSFELKTFGSLLESIKFPILLFFIRMTKIKIVLTLYIVLFYKNDSGWELPNYFTSKIPKVLIKILVKTFIRTICRLSHKVIVATHEGKECLVEYYGISEKKIDVIQLGVSQNTGIINQKIQEKYSKLFHGKNIILYYGVISPRKNYETVIRSLKSVSEKLPKHVLVIVGKASKEFESYEGELHELSRQLNLEQRIFFLGFIDKNDIDVLFRMAEMALYVYHPMPDSTTALTSAIQYNVPVIVSDIGIFREILSDNSALFVEPGNEVELTNAMLELSSNSQLRNQMRLEMQLLAKKFTWQKTASMYLEVYRKLLL